jgi:large subunit ribosomal protein L18
MPVKFLSKKLVNLLERVLSMLRKQELRVIRHKRLRKTLSGTAEKPRLSFYKSITFIYAQVIDDTKGHTLLAASTKDKDVKVLIKDGSLKCINAGKELGSYFGKKMKEAGVAKCVFDRGGFQYHGVVKEFADAVRKEGVKF